jgi:hypothetical protein
MEPLLFFFFWGVGLVILTGATTGISSSDGAEESEESESDMSVVATDDGVEGAVMGGASGSV